MTQSGGGIKAPGGSLTIVCKTSGFGFTNYYMSWVRKQPEKGLEWLCRMPSLGANPWYNPAIVGRFIQTRDNAKASTTLQLNDLKLQDSAVYYCTRDTVRASAFLLVQKPSEDSSAHKPEATSPSATGWRRQTRSHGFKELSMETGQE